MFALTANLKVAHCPIFHAVDDYYPCECADPSFSANSINEAIEFFPVQYSREAGRLVMRICPAHSGQTTLALYATSAVPMTRNGTGAPMASAYS